MIIKVTRYELTYQTDNSKPFVLYTIQIENKKKKPNSENASPLLNQVVPLDYSTPFDREYQYSYVEEFEDEFSQTDSSTSTNSGGILTPRKKNQQSSSSSPRLINHETCEFMENLDWTVTKRYSELLDYHQRFVEIGQSSLQSIKEIKSLFPKKLLIGNLKKENVDKRVDQFNEYFKKMVEMLVKEENTEVQKLVSHFFSSKPPMLSSQSNPSKNTNKNVDWMIHKPNSRNNWFFAAPFGFEKFSVSFDRRAEYISPIFQNVTIDTLISVWEKFISKQEKVELVDSNNDIYLYTYRQKSLINDFVTVQFIQDYQTKQSEITNGTDMMTSPQQEEEELDDMSNISPPNFESNVGDILRRFSIRRTTDFADVRDLLSDSSNHPFQDVHSTEDIQNAKFSIVLYSRSKFDLKDTNEKRVKLWLSEFKKLVMDQVPSVQLASSFQWD